MLSLPTSPPSAADPFLTHAARPPPGSPSRLRARRWEQLRPRVKARLRALNLGRRLGRRARAARHSGSGLFSASPSSSGLLAAPSSTVLLQAAMGERGARSRRRRRARAPASSAAMPGALVSSSLPPFHHGPASSPCSGQPRPPPEPSYDGGAGLRAVHSLEGREASRGGQPLPLPHPPRSSPSHLRLPEFRTTIREEEAGAAAATVASPPLQQRAGIGASDGPMALLPVLWICFPTMVEGASSTSP
ncbi:unnamed protein product [Urochloa humidicola]